VLVTDGEQRAALAVVRSLGAAGHHCTVASTRRHSLAGASRFAHRKGQVPDPLAEPGAFREAATALVKAEGIEVVVPITDPSLLALLPARGDLAPALLPWPDLETVRAVADKGAVAEAAASCGIAIPRQVVASGPDQVRAAAGSAIPFPLVIKPIRSVAGVEGERVKVGVRLVDAPERLEAALQALPAGAWPVLLQERIHGPGVGVFLLVWDGQTRAVFAHRRIREKPPAGGVSVYRESIAADPELVRKSRALLDAFGWEGVAMVEYKLDAVTGQPYLMEINGRFWGSLQLAVDAGVDFPRFLVELALGHDPGPPPAYRAGVRSRWCWGDVDHLLARLRHSREELTLPADSPGLGRVIADVLIPWRPGDRNEILRLSDPWPFVRETLDWLRGR